MEGWKGNLYSSILPQAGKMTPGFSSGGMKDEPLLLVENLVQQHGEGFRLQVPRFAVYPGRAYAVTGPNGSGKTTLLRTLAFLTPPASGTVTFDGVTAGRDAGHIQRWRRQATLVMQDAYLFKGSVFYNIAYGLRIRGLSDGEVRMRARRALEAVGMADFVDRKPHQLSRGETQRVAIARALALEPRLLLLDEPTANVDAANAEMIERIISRFMETQHMAVIFSTHQPDQAYRLADEVVSLRDGVMLDAGPANLFTGEVEQSADETLVRLSSGVSIQVPVVKTGRIHLRIPPEDILISRSPLESSARNSFSGAVISAVADGSQIRLGLDIGVHLTALITRQSFTEMGLTIGDRVYATFKTAAVQVF